MKLDCVLTAVNDKPLYIEFIPYWIKMWKLLCPSVDLKILLIANEIPQQYEQYEQYITLFKPIDGVSTAFTSQYIRILYPSLLSYKNGVLITDMDIVPMNSRYYIKNIEKYEDDKFVYLRDACMKQWKSIAICYNVATPTVWQQVNGIKTEQDVCKRLQEVFNTVIYSETNPRKTLGGWCKDQLDLYTLVIDFHKRTGNFRFIPDKNTGYRRLDRVKQIRVTPQLIQNIKSGSYSDYHCNRPYSSNKVLLERIYDILKG